MKNDCGRKFYCWMGIVVTFLVACGPSHSNMSALRNQDAAEAASKTLKTKQFRTITEAIQSLPAELRQNFALVRNSRSLQGSAPAAPRAVLFTKDGRFLATFNSDETYRGGNRLEWMYRSRLNTEYEFQSLEFANDTGTLSEVNPDQCKMCHGQENLTVWDVKPLWFNVHGESANWSEAEAQFVQANIPSWKANKRYRLLEWNQYAKVGSDTPAKILDQLFEESQIKNIVEWLEETPDFDQWKYAVKGALNSCDNFLSFFPPARKPTSELYKKIEDDTTGWLRRMQPETRATQTSQVLAIINALRWIFEERQVSLNSWTRTVGHPYLHTGNGLEFYRKISDGIRLGSEMHSCDQWQTASLAALEGNE